MFKFTETWINWLTVVEPQVFWDERGFFMETYSSREFIANWINVSFVQDNHSKSKAWVLRWLHCQTINTQAKLVRVVAWSVYDVAVDLRKASPTYWKWYGILLSAENKKQFFIPKWFAHWFLTLEDNTEFVYKCDDFYNPAWDMWILWNDSTLNINWWKYYDLEKLVISEKDTKYPKFSEFDKINHF
jgi:dTDP-4-dehydrorhamnose 3,5-epimerase